MAKKIIAVIKVHIPAGQATPAPPIGPALASHGVNIGEFCQKFNEQTKDRQGFKIPTEIFVHEDRTYTFKLHQPTAAQLLRTMAGIEKGSGEPNKKKVGILTRSQLGQIATQKMEDMNTKDIQ
ncbi:MAG: 50S ribosomal protein L11, partial [Candidatus Pacearchaeota archaeon]|nr:50S ribosomal protein L11 [Candidatus Pacearchaeota archaeon]